MRTYELCRSSWDPTNGSSCDCGTIEVMTCPECGAIIDDGDKHYDWHRTLSVLTMP